jgi:hypothetical protein
MRFLLFTSRKPLSAIGSIGRGLRALYNLPNVRSDSIADALSVLDSAGAGARSTTPPHQDRGTVVSR